MSDSDSDSRSSSPIIDITTTNNTIGEVSDDDDDNVEDGEVAIQAEPVARVCVYVCMYVSTDSSYKNQC